MDNTQFIDDNRQEQIDNAKMMTELLQDPRFKKLFQDIFVDAFAITNMYNLWSYDDPARRRFLEKSMARSHFSKFIDDILEDGRNAIESVHSESEQVE